MSVCSRRDEVVQCVRAGQWPQGCDAELRDHVSVCSRCEDEVRVMVAFAGLRAGAIAMASPQSAGLIWWKAQLRKKSAMARLEKPGFLSTATIVASMMLLVAALAMVWRKMAWASLFSGGVWLGIGVLCVCACAVVVVGMSEERG